MARKKGRRPWYRRSRGMWFITLGGRQIPTGITDPADRAGAEQFQRRAAAAPPAAPVDPPPPPPSPPPPKGEGGPTVTTAAAAFLDVAARKVGAGKLSPRTAELYRSAMAQLTAAFGTRPLAGLTADELEAWADRPEWSPSYQNQRLSIVMGMLRLAGVRLRIARPPVDSRGADAVIDEGQFAAVLRALVAPRGRPGDLAALLTLLWETGARPGEGAGLTAEQVDWANCLARLRHHKTRKRTGRDRVLVFNAAAMEVLKGQREKYGSGLLFRTRYGNAYDRHTLAVRMIGVSERVGFHVTCYSFRHTFATRALARGVPDAVVAALLGHTSTAMIHAHYGHLNEQSRVLREAAEKASGSRPAA